MARSDGGELTEDMWDKVVEGGFKVNMGVEVKLEWDGEGREQNLSLFCQQGDRHHAGC